MQESLNFRPISDLVTFCHWLWVVSNMVVVCVNDKTLVDIP